MTFHTPLCNESAHSALVSMNEELDETFQEEANFAEDLSKVDYYAYEYLIDWFIVQKIYIILRKNCKIV